MQDNAAYRCFVVIWIVCVAVIPTGISHAELNPVLIRSRAADLRTLHNSSLAVGEKIQFDLFPDAMLRGVVEHVDIRAALSFSIAGHLVEDPGSWFALAVEDDALVANIHSQQHGSFQIRPIPGQLNVRIDQVDAAALGGCDCDATHLVRTAAGAVQPNQPQTAADDGETSACHSIDVMIAYTPAARNAIGSDAATHALAYASVAVFNIVNSNSLVMPRMRLVHVVPVDFAETSNLALDLARVQSPNDGIMDELHPLREQFGADLVSLLVHSTSSSCGVAYVMVDPSTEFSQFAFSVVQQNCAITNLSFPHELAHNLGSQHDWSDSSEGAFPYSHGLRFTGDSGLNWRTVMAGTPGTRIPFFSNPNIVFDGVPIGVPENQPNPADNARSINNVAAIAAAFQSAAISDCNNNGTADDCDIHLGTSLDVNENGVPDECDAPPCAAHTLEQLTVNDAASFDNFGNSVSMSDDRVIIGGVFNDDAGPFSGSVYVFKRGQANRWNQEAKLLPADAVAFQYFGHSVALSPGGTYALVGAPRDGFQISDVGAAYVFHFDGSQWSQIAKFENPDPQQADWFGWSVAWAGHDNGELFAVVSSVFDDEVNFDSGAVYVYRRNKTGWDAPVKLTASDAQLGDRMGYSVAADVSGERIIAGAPFVDAGASNVGAAYVFRRTGNSWIQEAKLSADVSFADARLGWSVSIDGSRALAGAIRDSEIDVRAGAAIAFVRYATTIWSQDQKLFAVNAAMDKQFGASVALRGDHAIVGSILDTVAGNASGSVSILHHDGVQWQPQALVAPHDGAALDHFGNAVAMAPDESIAVAAAFLDDHHGAIDAGSVSVFSLTISRNDCNANGIDDACDISGGISADKNRNTIPDECEPTCDADVALHDGVVNVHDLLAVIDNWGPCTLPCPTFVCAADVNGDCLANVQDLLAVITNWGRCR